MAGPFLMARPRRELGTPRFSVIHAHARGRERRHAVDPGRAPADTPSLLRLVLERNAEAHAECLGHTVLTDGDVLFDDLRDTQIAETLAGSDDRRSRRVLPRVAASADNLDDLVDAPI